MRYTPLQKDDFDTSFKYERKSFLCYSGKKLKEISPDKNYKIVGLARKTNKRSDNEIILGDKTMTVFDTEKSSPMYKSIGYLPVNEENDYIAIQETRVPFLIILSSTVATTAVICTLLMNPSIPDKPMETITTQTFNPLPPVDVNLEDFVDETSYDDTDGEEDLKGGGKVRISYKSEAEVKLSTGEVTMEYQNPQSSSHDAVVNLYVVSDNEEYLIASSGRIPAGKQLKEMNLTADKELFSSEGRYNAEYRVFYYDSVTGERALTEATINDITLTVRS